MDPRISTERRWRSGEWRAVAAGLAMVAAIAVVWALIATFTLLQRNRDLAKATLDLNDLREDYQRLESQHVPLSALPPLQDFEIVDDVVFVEEPDIVDELEQNVRQLLND